MHNMVSIPPIEMRVKTLLPYIIIMHELLCTLMTNVHAFALDRQCAGNVHRLLLI